MGSMEELLKIAKGGKAAGAGGVPNLGAMPGGMPDLTALLGSEELKGMDPKELSKQAGQLWKMLDEMAENDEAGYAEFIRKQAEGAQRAADEHRAASDPSYAAMLAAVEGHAPAMVLQARVISAKQPLARAVVEVWESKPGKVRSATVGDADHAHVVTADTCDFRGVRIPLLEARPPRMPESNAAPTAGVTAAPTARPAGVAQQPTPPPTPPGTAVFSLAVACDTARLALSGSPPQLRLLLAEAAAQCVEERHGLKLQRGNWRVLLNPDLLPEQERAVREAAASASHATASASGTAAEGLSAALLGEIGSMATRAGRAGPGAAGRVASGAPAAGDTTASAAGPRQGGAAGGARGAASARVGASASNDRGASRGPLIVELGGSGSGAGGGGGSGSGADGGGGSGGGSARAHASASASACAGVGVSAASTAAPAGRASVGVSGVGVGSAVTVSVSTACREDGTPEVVVAAHLPHATSARDVSVEVVGREVVLTSVAGDGGGDAPRGVLGRAQLPFDVDDGAARARFDKRTHTLTVRLPARS